MRYSTDEKRSTLRIIVGFLLAPTIGLLPVGVIMCAPSVMMEGFGTFSSCWDSAMVELIVGPLGATFAYAGAALFGIPLFFAQRNMEWMRWWQVAAGGLAAGMLSTLSIAVMTASLPAAGEVVLFCCGVGLFAGLSFWLIAIYRNGSVAAARQ